MPRDRGPPAGEAASDVLWSPEVKSEEVNRSNIMNAGDRKVGCTVRPRLELWAISRRIPCRAGTSRYKQGQRDGRCQQPAKGAEETQDQPGCHQLSQNEAAGSDARTGRR